jgi:hypothetical protein
VIMSEEDRPTIAHTIDPTSPHDGGPLKRHRAAMTNDPVAARMSRRTTRGRRVKDLYEDLIAGKPPGAYLAAQALRVAELTASAESLRAKLDVMLDAGRGKTATAEEIKALSVLVNAVTRFESTARRAAADLGKSASVEEDPVAALRAYLNKDSDDGDTKDDH